VFDGIETGVDLVGDDTFGEGFIRESGNGRGNGLR
jgi:hypothetical protein